ncbi:MAG: transglutaminase-like domain-containing protein [Candidatus Njordarchaeia archaeon]
MVKIHIPVLRKKKESKSLVIPPTVLVIVLILSSIIGVFYFHADYSPVKPKDDINETWFEHNNRAFIPPDLTDLFENLSDMIKDPDLSDDYPELDNPENLLSGLLSNKTDFCVLGHAPSLVWKISSFSDYVENRGWVFATADLEDYEPTTFGGELHFEVIKENVSVNGRNKLFVASMFVRSERPILDPPSVESAYTNESTTVSVDFSLFYDKVSGGIIVQVDTNVKSVVSFRYELGADTVDKAEVSYLSSSIQDTRNFAASNSELSRLAMLPENYLSNHPEVADLLNNVYLGDYAKVYDQVQEIANYLAVNFDMTMVQAPSGEDPVAWFVRNGGGAPIYFLYTAALLLRGYGIPARIAIGYLNGEYDAALDRTCFVPTEHLFLWLEVYDSGYGGWVPYNILPGLFSAFGERPQNIVDVSFTPIIYVYTPRKVQGIDSVYLNETFSIQVLLIGVNDPASVGDLYVYDANESAIIGYTSFTPVAQGLQAVFVATFEDIYNTYLSGRDPLYGVHVLILTIGSHQYPVVIALLQRVSISP